MSRIIASGSSYLRNKTDIRDLFSLIIQLIMLLLRDLDVEKWFLFKFALKVKQRRANIQRILATVMLWVFFLALTPWSSFHHHQEVKYSCNNETICTHKVHLSTHADQCLVCSAHFEKTYILTHYLFNVYENPSIYIKNQHIEHALYLELISTSLRGPPIA
jgi:hypothetical protein